MPQAVDSIASELEQVTARLRELERRVALLEGHPETTAERASDQAPSYALQRPRPPATWRGFPPVEMQGGAVAVLGKAVLGIAGAYLLRAIAELGSIPKLPVLVVAMVYATLWMVWAVRTHDTSHFASVTYGVTSALILSPLLWEATVRFQALPPAFTALVLVAFAALSLVLAWGRNLQVIPWIATLATVITSLALIIATRDLAPFTAALLAAALATEVAACLGHRLSLRVVPALAADFAVWLLIDVMTSEVLPEGYHPAGPFAINLLCFGLLAVYGGSIGVRSFALRQRMTIFEIGQGVLAFVLATYGVIRATHGSASPWLGVMFLLLAAVCYWGALSRFAPDDQSRNRRVSAAWAAALLLAGSFLLFPTNLQVPFLCLAAIAGAFLYSRTHKFSLGLHASFYLATATAVSPLPAYASNALAGNVPGAPELGIWIVGAAAVLCYVIGARVLEDRSRRRMLWVVPAVLAGFTGAALVVAAIAGLDFGRMELAAPRLSVIRTIVNCALALALAYGGSHWKRVELGWVAYTAIAFGTLKLLLEDLRFGNAASLVVSLLFYGLVLILLPRLTRRSESTA